MAEYVGVSGLDQVLRNLKGLDGELKRKGLLAGAKAGAGVFKKQIKSLPITPEESGALKRAISVKQMKKSLTTKSDIVGAMVIFRTGGARTKKQEENDRDGWYWFLHEYGWYAGGRFRKKITGRYRTRGGRGRVRLIGEKLVGNRGLTIAGFRAKTKRTKSKTKGIHFVKKSFMSKSEKIKDSYEKRIAKFVDNYNGR